MRNEDNRSLLSLFQKRKLVDTEILSIPLVQTRLTSSSTLIILKRFNRSLAKLRIPSRFLLNPKAESYPKVMMRELGRTCGRKSSNHIFSDTGSCQVVLALPLSPWTAIMLSEVSTMSDRGRHQPDYHVDDRRLTLSLEKYQDQVLQDEGIRQTTRAAHVCEK